MTVPLVAIVGRPNVGKSTFFNRLVGGRQAIEEKSSGVTRDRLYGRAEWLGRIFQVVDTGGLDYDSREEDLQRQVQRQVQVAIEEAAVVIFLVDGREGLAALDEEIADMLRRRGKPVVLAVNKIDSSRQDISDFYRLGFEEPVPVSAAHGLNIGDLLDRVSLFFSPGGDESAGEKDAIRIAVVGRPNVGKSSFINALLGEKRVIVNSEPGTTRDAIDTHLERDNQDFVLVDTAGIRKKSRVKENVEYYSVLRSLRAIESADIAILLLDASEGVTEQDQKIAGYVLESGRALIISLNKWDLVQQKHGATSAEGIIEDVKKSLHFVSFAPFVFTSIYHPQLAGKLFPLFQEVYRFYTMRVSTPLLNRLLGDAQAVNPPPSSKGRKGRIYYWTQPHVKPPTFVLFVNDRSLIHFSYLRYLENRLREAFLFKGTPIRLLLRTRSRKGGR